MSTKLINEELMDRLTIWSSYPIDTKSEICTINPTIGLRLSGLCCRKFSY